MGRVGRNEGEGWGEIKRKGLGYWEGWVGNFVDSQDWLCGTLGKVEFHIHI